MSKLPRQVQRDLDAAEALQRQLAESQAPTPGVVSDLAQLAPAPAPEPTPAPPAPAPAEPAPQLPPAEPQRPKAEDWEHKYRVLQGMFNKQAESFNGLKTQLDQLQAKVNKPAEPAPAPAQKPAVDPKDYETFGKDMIEMVQRHAESVFGSLSQQFSARFAELDNRIAGVEQNLTGVSKQTTLSLEQLFWKDLASQVPDWNEINNSDKFLAWLAEVDPVFGYPRQAALQDAQNKFDAARVAAMFKTFKSMNTPPVVQQQANPLAAQVAPSTTASAPAPVQQADSEIITITAVNQFYDAVRRGKYRGREAEAEAIEARINKAAAEGRIQG